SQLGERVAALLAMDDDPVEALEEPEPQVGLVGGAAGEKVVRREDGGQVRVKEERVELRDRQPLHVEEVGLQAATGGDTDRALGHPERQAQPRPAEEPRREGVEELPAAISVRLRDGPEA